MYCYQFKTNFLAYIIVICDPCWQNKFECTEANKLTRQKCVRNANLVDNDFFAKINKYII